MREMYLHPRSSWNNFALLALHARTKEEFTCSPWRKIKREREREGGDHKTDRLTKITAIDRHGAIRIRLFGELLFLVPSFVSGTISFERRRLRG